MPPASGATIPRDSPGPAPVHSRLTGSTPAAELREQVGGYTIIDCPDLDDALKWAAAIPAARDSSVEVRAIVDMGRQR